MVSPVLAQAILGQKAPDIVGEFRKGREIARQEQARELAGRAVSGEAGALAELQGIDPIFALKIGEQIGARDERSLNDFVKSAGVARRMLEAGDVAGAQEFIDQRVSIMTQQGGNPQPALKLRQMIAQGNPEGALNEIRSFEAALGQARELTAGQREFAGLTKGLSPEEQEKARRIKLGLEARATPATPERERKITRSKELAKQSVKLSGEAFKQLPKIRKNILNIDNAIRALDKGAKTGAIEKFFPSIRAASIELDNLRGQMGLDVIGSVTFGALSEAELNFALETALPTGLNEPELKQWLKEKREAQKKVAKALTKHAKFFGKGGTIAELIEKDEAEQQEAPPAGQIKILGIR